jgi:hypothetical protein
MRPRLSRTSALFTSAAPRWLALVLITWNTAPAFAQSCKDDGGLAYLGNTREASRSVWLSGTVAGSFSLEAAQGNTTVDTWSRETRGLHISTSPFVSSGSGGTHRLFNTSGNNGCLIDTQNQKRDFVLPNIRPPSGVLPPIGGFFPDFGGLMPSRPGLGQINLPQLPGSGPTGVMPGCPWLCSRRSAPCRRIVWQPARQDCVLLVPTSIASIRARRGRPRRERKSTCQSARRNGLHKPVRKALHPRARCP